MSHHQQSAASLCRTNRRCRPWPIRGLFERPHPAHQLSKESSGRNMPSPSNRPDQYAGDGSLTKILFVSKYITTTLALRR